MMGCGLPPLRYSVIMKVLVTLLLDKGANISTWDDDGYIPWFGFFDLRQAAKLENDCR